EVGAHGDDVAFGGQDLRDRPFGCALMLEVDDDDCPAPARQHTRDLPAGSRRAARDDRHYLCAEPLRVATIVAIADHLLLELARRLSVMSAQQRGGRQLGQAANRRGTITTPAV